MNEWKVIEEALRPYLRCASEDAVVAREVIRGLASAGFVLVEIPVPSDIGNWGPVWNNEGRYDGPIGTVQYRPEIDRIEIRDDFEHDYAASAVWQYAAVLLAACCYAAQRDSPQ